MRYTPIMNTQNFYRQGAEAALEKLAISGALLRNFTGSNADLQKLIKREGPSLRTGNMESLRGRFDRSEAATAGDRMPTRVMGPGEPPMPPLPPHLAKTPPTLPHTPNVAPPRVGYVPGPYDVSAVYRK